MDCVGLEQGSSKHGRKGGEDTREYGFRHGVVASTWAFEAQGPGSIPGGGAHRWKWWIR